MCSIPAHICIGKQGDWLSHSSNQTLPETTIRRHSSRPIRGASRVCYWSPDFGAGVLKHSAVGKSDKLLGYVFVSLQVCGTLYSYQTSPSIWSRTDSLDKLTQECRTPSSPPPTQTCRHFHIYSNKAPPPPLLSWTCGQCIIKEMQSLFILWFFLFSW